MSHKNQPLKVELLGDTLSITIGTAALSAELLARQCPSDGTFVVEDEYSLACQVVIELRRSLEIHNASKARALLMLLSVAQNCDALIHRGDPAPTEDA